MLLIVTAGFRNQGGTDYIVYEYDYYGIKSFDGNGLKAMLEFGYTGFVSFCRSLGLSYNQFIAMYSLVCLSALFSFFRRYCVFPFLSLLIYFSSSFMYYNMVALRQMLPLSLAPFAFLMLYRKKYLWYLIIILSGSSFHNSFLVMLAAPIFLLRFNPLKKKNLCIAFACACVAKQEISPLLEAIMNLDPAIALRVSELNGDGQYSFVFTIKLVFFTAFILYYRNIFKDGFSILLLNAYLLSVLFPICFWGSGMIFRLSSFFEISVVYLIPYIICHQKTWNIQHKTKVYLIAAVWYTFFFLRSVANMDNGAFFTYNFYFL